MPDLYDPIPDLAALIRDAAYGDRSATRRVEALLPRLGVGGNDPVSVEAIEAGLRKALGLADSGTEPAEPSLGERVTASLLAAGFRQHQPSTDAKLAAFSVNEADGDRVTVSVIWAANDEWRGKVLAKLGEALRADGFTTRPAGGCLYVDPERAGQDPDAIGTDAR